MSPQLRLALAFTLLLTSLVPPSSAQKLQSSHKENIRIRVSEGSYLSFDISNDGRLIVFDLLGQLWLVPAQGGKARPLTNAVRDLAEDLDPVFSPDTRQVVFRGERNGRTGLWLLDVSSGQVRQLTQLSDPDGFERDVAWSPDGRRMAFVRSIAPSGNRGGRFAIFLLELATGKIEELPLSGVATPFLSAPIWNNAGKQIAFVALKAPNSSGGRVWIAPTTGGSATPVTAEDIDVRALSVSADGKSLAYIASDSDGRPQVWLAPLEGNTAPVRLTNNADVTPTRIRWIPNSTSLLYSADGKLWRINTTNKQIAEIHFNAELSITRRRANLPQAHFPEPGQENVVRGFTGLALSPDGKQIGMLALGKLWTIAIGGTPRVITDVPFEASSIAWSPDGTEIAWSAGVSDREDLFATDLKTGNTRQLTSLPGREAYPTYSPDGRYLAFIHVKDDGFLRVIDTKTDNVADVSKTRDLGSIGVNWTSTPQWSPNSNGLLVCGGQVPNQPGTATFISLSGQRQTVTPFPVAPIFLQWTPQNEIVFVRHDRLWRAPFAQTSMTSAPRPLGNDAALYASTSRDGSVLFVAETGLVLRRHNGAEQELGWPISYTPPVAESLLIRNVRIVAGTGAPPTNPRDLLIQRGRITRIAAPGTLSIPATRVIDAAGKFAMPGLIDLHAHLYRPGLLPSFLYFGVTTVRDQGAAMAPLVAYANAFAAGVLEGPRVAYGGFQFYSDWAFDEEQGRGIEPESDPNHIRRAVALAQAFGAQHIKTRTFRRWDINARMIEEAHRRGMRATGHCSLQLPLVAAGMDAKEHTGLCGPRGNTFLYDDLVQLFKAAGIGVVPTIIYLDFAARLNEHPALLDEDKELAPFLPDREAFEWMLKLPPQARKSWSLDAHLWRQAVVKLSRAGVRIGTGTDIWQVPTGVHMELEELVAAGLTPSQAIRAATADAAKILGADRDLGTIEVGKWADLLLLEADPSTEIRNSRRIWRVIHYGRLVDRQAILKSMRPR